MESLNILESHWQKKGRVKRACTAVLFNIFSRRMLASLMGVIAALLVAEIALRPFATNSINLALSREEVRQYYEGTAVSHFSPDGGRCTGNEFIPGAPAGLILGDSHVEAIQVDDQATMGSVLERIFRMHGEPLNVRQYGWSGVAAPMYIAVAEPLLREYDPAWVAVTLNSDDLGIEPLSRAWAWQMKINPDCSVSLVDVLQSPSTVLKAKVVNTARSHSSLISVASETAYKIMNSQQAAAKEKATIPPVDKIDNPDVAFVPRATVRGLKSAYGSRLLIVYIPDIGAVGGSAPDGVEAKLLDACHQEGVACISTRAAMITDRDKFSRLSRGFHNTAPGSGHLNEIGHEIVAREIWRMVSTNNSCK